MVSCDSIGTTNTVNKNSSCYKIQVSDEHRYNVQDEHKKDGGDHGRIKELTDLPITDTRFPSTFSRYQSFQIFKHLIIAQRFLVQIHKRTRVRAIAL
jgi:hypothetical protein